MRSLEIDVEKRRELWDRLARGVGNRVVCLAECCFHVIEAPVEVHVFEQLDEFEVFVLKAVRLLRRPSLQELDGLMHVGRQTLRQAAAALVGNGLLAEDTGDSLRMTAKGITAVESGLTKRNDRRRRLFHFIHPSREYVHIRYVRRTVLHDLKRHETPSDWRFDVAILRQCIASPDEWKRDREFPTDVVQLITNGDLNADQPHSDNVNSSAENGGSVTKEISQLDNLIVDTAQAGQYAIVVGFDGDHPAELRAYSLVQLHSTARAAQRTLFSVRGTETIMRILPGLRELRAPERLREAWQVLAQHCGLEGPDRATIHIDETQIVVGLDDSLTMEWLGFCWQVVRGEIFACVALPGMSCLCMLTAQPRDEASKSRLDALRLLCKLGDMRAFETPFIDMPTFMASLSENGYTGQVDIHELSSLAWQLGEFRLAYNLAELEDMVDVHVQA